MTKQQTAKMSATVFISKQENAGGALHSNAKANEDVFKKFYIGESGAVEGAAMLEPPYMITNLRETCRENDALAPCIDAMIVNIDGTGYTIVNDDDTETNGDTVAENLKEFLNSLGIKGESFLSMRRLFRRDLEETGMMFIEVIRNAMGEIVFARRVEPEYMRLVKLDDPTDVKITVNRLGGELSVTVSARERRFAQIVSNNPVFFKEFGATRDLDKNTGKWGKGEVNKTVPANDRATEIIYYNILEDDNSPYGLPRWISSKRSVRGQVEAENLNLEFFNSGGVPPVLIAVEGGELTDDAKETLANIFSGKAAQKMEAAIIEATQTGGQMGQSATVRLNVHQFGSQSQNDGMFKTYISDTEEKTRKTFRLPPVVLGKTEKVNFATAYTSYMLAESQVFEPERLAFDDVINNTLLKDPSMGGGKYKIKSNPLNLKNVENRIKAIELASNKGSITSDQLVSALNAETGLTLKYDPKALDKEAQEAAERTLNQLATINPTNPVAQTLSNGRTTASQTPNEPPSASGVVKSESSKSPLALIELAKQVSDCVLDSKNLTKAELLQQEVALLDDHDFASLRAIVAQELLNHETDGGILDLVFPDNSGACC